MNPPKNILNCGLLLYEKLNGCKYENLTVVIRKLTIIIRKLNYILK